MTRRTLATFSSLAALWMVLPKHGAVAISPYSEMDQNQFSVRALSQSGLNRTSSSYSLSVVLAVAAFPKAGGPCISDADCDDTDECSTDACDIPNGVCTHEPVDCGDGDACTTDTCDPLIGCQHDAIVCDDGDACTTDGCDPALGCTTEPVDCDDSDLCTTDTCDPVVGCQYEAVVCDDGNACTMDSCDPLIGCQYDAIVCDDGDACTTDGCDPASGCTVEPVDCDDNDLCTTDTCDSVVGCQYEAVVCDDVDACTTDTCDPLSGCQHDAIVCDDGDACTTDGCDPAEGCTTEPVDCDDSDLCTTDTCDPVVGCQYEAVVCDDVDACTTDACDPLIGCQYEVIVCDDEDACTTDECDPAAGCTTEPVDCNDRDLCTTDTCDPASGCNSEPVDCDDGDACTDDSCDNATGKCVNEAVNCDDNDLCTDDSCDLADGCVNTPTNLDCDDSDACTDDFCDPATGACGHATISCDDNDLCTDDLCDPATGCSNPPIDIDCEDLNPCTDDFCDPATGTCANDPIVTEFVDLTSGVQGNICQASFRPLASDGEDASFLLTARSSIDINNPTDPDAQGDPATTSTSPRGAGVKRANCSGSDDIAGSGGSRDEELIVTFDEAVRSDKIVISLNQVDFQFDEPVVFILGTDGIIYVIEEPEIMAAFTATGASRGNVDFGAFTTVPVGLFTTGFKVRETQSHTYVDEISISCFCDPANCADGDPCTDDLCDLDTETCTTAPTDCDDGDACTTDSCDSGSGCVYELVDCGDADPCTLDLCDPDSGACTNPPVDCDDGDACTLDSCDPLSGLCLNEVIDCDDGDACTADSCDVDTGCLNIAVDCDDGDDCTVDGCDPLTGDCSNELVDCDDDDLCTIDSCDAESGACLNIPVDCDDGSACTLDSCDPLSGLCLNEAIDCDDGDACTADSCDVDTGCLNIAVDCDDGDDCTVDGCDPLTGDCSNELVDCDDDDLCTIDNCDPRTGLCVNELVSCEDADACTTDSCDPFTGNCLNDPVTCDDADACTIDSCDPAAGCMFEPIACDDDNVCTADGCDPLSGECVFQPLVCDDGDLCTTDGCDPVSGCFSEAVDCDDGDACTTDSCDAAGGACVNDPVDCDDGDACTADACDEETGLCNNLTITCDDANACTTDSCDEAIGCVNQTIDCDDMNACTLDSCDPELGTCVYSEVDCDDLDLCTSDDCDPSVGCINEPLLCGDGDPCNGIEFCAPADGTCQPGVITDCNDNSIDDSCDIAGGGSPDCNENGVPDECDIADGTSPDKDGSGVPDECENPCLPTDLTHDGIVGAADLAQLLGAWGPNPGHPADFNHDDTVAAADLAQMLGCWGLVKPPEVFLQPGARTRYYIEPGASLTLAIRYTTGVPTTINIYSRPAGLPPSANVILLGQILVPPGEDIDTTVTIDTTELGVGAATVLLGTNQFVSGTSTENNALTDPTNSVSGAAVLYIGNALDAPLNPQVNGQSGVEAAEPPFINLALEVGEPRAVTSGTGVQPFEADEVVHPGVGVGDGDTFRRVGPGVAQRKTIVGEDFDGDGYGDVCTIGAANAPGTSPVLHIMFGTPHLLTAGGNANGSPGAVNGDWNAPVNSYMPGIGTAIILPANGPGERIVAIGSGDFNGDGHRDLAAVSNTALANTVSHVYVLLLSGGPDPAVGASLRTYTTRGTQNAATGEGLHADVAVADFTADGIDDLAVSVPGEDADGVSNDEGAVYVIYGRPGTLPANNLPPSGSLTVAAAGSNGVALNGTVGSDEFFGASLGVGNFDGGPMDLWVATAGAGTTTGGLFLFPGVDGSLSALPAIQYTYAGPTDMLGSDGLPGDIIGGSFTNEAGTFDDVIVGLPGENAVRIIPPTINTSGPITRNGIVDIINTRTVSVGFLGHATALGDLDGDGDLDLIVGNYGTGDAYVLFGPISSNGPPLRYSDTDNDFDMALLSGQDTGQAVRFGDITADSVAELWLADPSADVQCLTGLSVP